MPAAIFEHLDGGGDGCLCETRATGVLLALHLGVVMALFLTMPYGKFVHGLYRFAALVRFHVERSAAAGGNRAGVREKS